MRPLENSIDIYQENWELRALVCTEIFLALILYGIRSAYDTVLNKLCDSRYFGAIVTYS